MRVIQVLTTLSFGDAVSNHAIAIKKLLEDNGYKTAIYAENLDQRLASRPGLYRINDLPRLNKDDIMIYHLSTGTDLNRQIKNFICRKYVIYHNVTPAHFFSKYSGITARLCQKGRAEVKSLNETFDGGMGVSDYNVSELREAGYKCKLTVCPILIPFEDYRKTPNSEVMSKFSREGSNYDGYKNVVFVGRIAPNKKQEDLIALMAAYKKLYEGEKVRLILVGSCNGTESYQKRLEGYVEALGLDDTSVVFTGQVSFDSILAYYASADAFVCMSEHEGFCVPLVEAMCFHKPILAASYAAIPDTLNGSGILLEDKDMARAAFYLHEILNDEELSRAIVEKQDRRLEDFSYEKVSAQFMEQFGAFMKGEA